MALPLTRMSSSRPCAICEAAVRCRDSKLACLEIVCRPATVSRPTLKTISAIRISISENPFCRKNLFIRRYQTQVGALPSAWVFASRGRPERSTIMSQTVKAPELPLSDAFITRPLGR